MADLVKLTILLLTLLVLSPNSVNGGPGLYGICIGTCYSLYMFGLVTATAATGGAAAVAAAGWGAASIAAVGTAMSTSGTTFGACATACTAAFVTPTP